MRCKFQRLPEALLGEPEQIEELTAEVVSSLEDHLGWKRVNHHRQWRNLV